MDYVYLMTIHLELRMHVCMQYKGLVSFNGGLVDLFMKRDYSPLINYLFQSGGWGGRRLFTTCMMTAKELSLEFCLPLAWKLLCVECNCYILTW